MRFLIIYFVITLCYSSLVTFADISPCAKWNTTGVTVAGNGVSGGSSEQLTNPEGIFIHKQSNRLYVVDLGNKRIQMFELSNLSSQAHTVASFETYPSKIYVDDDTKGPTVYVSFSWDDGHVEKWVNGASKGVQVGDECRFCSGIWVDKAKNVYMAESGRSRILKWSPKTNNSTVVAGQTDMDGRTADLLNWPDGITVDGTNGDIYIADHYNNRTQKWMKDAEQGITVAGSSMGTAGTDAASLSGPSDVLIDQDTKTVYVVDRKNERIQRWLVNASSGDTIVGGLGKGNSSNQFNEPTDMDFDNQGNLYVSDSYNHRVQMFALIDNRPCSSTSTTSSTTESSSTSTATSTTSSTTQSSPTSTTSSTTESPATSTTSSTTQTLPTSTTSSSTDSSTTLITTTTTSVPTTPTAHATMIKTTMSMMVFPILLHLVTNI